jgi:hypothetical protein
MCLGAGAIRCTHMSHHSKFLGWTLAALLAGILLARIAAAASGESLRITANGKVSYATLADGDAAHDFASLLPITLQANDLIGREKYARLSRTLARSPATPVPLEVGDIFLVSPGSDVLIFYSHEGQTIPSPGSVLLAKWNGASAALDGSDTVQLTIERTQSIAER